MVSLLLIMRYMILKTVEVTLKRIGDRACLHHGYGCKAIISTTKTPLLCSQLLIYRG